MTVLGSQDRAGDARRERRLQRAGGARTEPLRIEPSLTLESVQPVQLLGVVAVRCHHQRPGLRISGGHSAALLELRGKARPKGPPLEVEGQERLLAEVGLGHGREHPRGDAGRARARRVALDDEHRYACLRRSPRTRQSDDSGPHHDEVVGASLRPCSMHVLYLRRHYPDQVLRSAAVSPPSQPDVPGSRLDHPRSYPGRSARMPGMSTGSDRRRRLAAARLYFVTDAGIHLRAVRAALAGGVDMLQLRDPTLADEQLLETAARFRDLCDERGALLWINDRPDLAIRAGADGVHLGQADMPVADARREVGPEMLIGLSTHSVAQLDDGLRAGADQLSVGPVWETPTKPGRPAAGLDYVRAAAARRPDVPWFAIGGIDSENVAEVLDAGAERVVVVRAIRDAADTRAAAAELRAALERGRVGAAQ